MPDAPNITEISSFFAAAISIIFGVWYEQTAVVLSSKMPQQQLDRKPYIKGLWRTAVTKVLPIGAFLIGYIFIFGGQFLDLVFERDLADLYGGHDGIDAAASIFCLIFSVIAYLFVVTAIQAWGIASRLLTAHRKPNDGPRVRKI